MNTKLILNSKTWKTLDRNNEYFEHINQCKQKKYDKETQLLHIHHIIPQYVIGNAPDDQEFLNSPENLILLSLEDHAKAHELLYKIYGNKQDQGAVLMINSQMNEAHKIYKTLGAEASHKVQKEQNKTFWDNDFQKEMAKRSLARSDALEIRSKGGKKGGKARQAGRAIKPEEAYVFLFKNKEVVCILNCQDGGEVLEELNKFQVTGLKRVSPLLNKTKKSLHGWSCEKIEKNTN